MTLTTHGHHIPGTVLNGRAEQKRDCGGPGVCKNCTREWQRTISAPTTKTKK